MRNFFSNKLAYVAILSLFTLACAWNMTHGTPTFSGHFPLANRTLTSHGPSLPPDPWNPPSGNLTAHGPSLPPDPWNPPSGNLTTHGPSLPPDPWNPRSEEHTSELQSL